MGYSPWGHKESDTAEQWSTNTNTVLIQHRECSQYFIITTNNMEIFKIVNHYVVHLKLI